jgi:hypothetical protein
MGWVVSVTPRPRFTPGERTPGTHWTGGWVGPRAVLDTEARGKILCVCRGSNLDRPVFQSVARRYTDWAITAPSTGGLFWIIWKENMENKGQRQTILEATRRGGKAWYVLECQRRRRGIPTALQLIQYLYYYMWKAYHNELKPSIESYMLIYVEGVSQI